MKLLGLLHLATRQAIAAPNVGIVVSGGLDSSTVCAIARKYHPMIPTFTGFYDEPGFSELPYAKLVAGHNWTPIKITPQDFIDNFDDMVPFLREPFQGMGTFGQYMVAKKLAADGIEVALSGEGADELFGGYARLMIVAGENPPEGYENYEVPIDYPRDLDAALAYDYERLPDLLAVDDQCLAAWGIQARAPFTDPAVVEYALALDPLQRVAKRTLKDAVRGLVPDQIIDRTDKKGFPVPLVQWAQGPLRDFIGDRIGYVPDPDKPWDRQFWYDLLYDAVGLPSAA
jgi:asparagine synthase (glutamine-hydrolysing)